MKDRFPFRYPVPKSHCLKIFSQLLKWRKFNTRKFFYGEWLGTYTPPLLKMKRTNISYYTRTMEMLTACMDLGSVSSRIYLHDIMMFLWYFTSLKAFSAGLISELYGGHKNPCLLKEVYSWAIVDWYLQRVRKFVSIHCSQVYIQ